MSQIAEVLRLARDLMSIARRAGGVVPVDVSDLPLKALAAGIADRGDQLGLIWRLVPGTIGTPGTGGEMRVTLEGDSQAIPATSMIGRLPVGARVFVILSPPAGVHIAGFMGYDFPPSVPGEAIGRPRMLVQTQAINSSSSTFLDVPGISFNAVANGQYEIRLRLSPAALPADDYKVQWTTPASIVSMDRYVLMPAPTYGGNDSNAITIMSMFRGGAGSIVGGGIAAIGGSATHQEDILFKNGPNAGTVQCQWARSASTGSAATLRANGYAIVQRYR